MAFSAITARGSNVSTASHASLAVSPTAALTVGKIVFVSCVSDNLTTTEGASTYHSVSDTHTHTWTKVFEHTDTAGAAADGSTTSLWWTKITTQIETTNSITNTYQGGNNDAGIIALVEATVESGNTVASETPNIVHTDVLANEAISAVLSGLTSREYLFFGLLGLEGNDNAKGAIANYTEQFDLRSGANSTADVCIHVGTRILTGTGDTWQSTSVTGTNGLQSLTGFYEVAGAPTGTIAVTQADQTSAIAAVEIFTGTIAITQAVQTSAISGVVANPVTGTIAVTQADQTSAITALETFTGTIAVTQADQTSNISGTVGAAGVTGTIAVTQNDQTSAISGLETILGTIAVTQADQTSAISGTVLNPVTGTIAVTQADQTAAFAGTHTINITGTIAVTQDNQTAAFAGVVVNPITGTITVTQADQVMSAAGLLIISGSVAVTQADQTFTASGVVANPVTGTIAVTQANQIAGWTGFVGAITFWQRNAVAYTVNPAAYVPVGADDDPPW